MESPIRDESFRDLTLAAFGERLASSDPVPGGGSASAVAASLAASLVAMVGRLSQGRPKYAEHAALYELAIPAAHRLERALLDVADEDAAAYAACAVALKLPREADEDRAYRDQQVKATARVAAEVPLRCVELCHDVLVLADALAGRSNVNAASDLRVASLLAEAAGNGAAENVLVNLPLIGEDDWTREAKTRVEALLTDIAELKNRVLGVVSSGDRRPPLETLPEVRA
ncbi:MAG TPA: cyclodeaminase/cyclohydrolase family protein [Candidatus Binatia bacterium]|nr:cyclodeaminase/cyclohydrolase family protein [Candidatus Binatia bacterium]